MSDHPSYFSVGETFTCYEEFQAKLDHYEQATGNRLYKRDCRTIDAAKKRATKKNFNPALVYAALHFCCVHGGRYRSRSTGARPNQRTLKLGCPMELKLATTSDGQELLVTGFVGEHVHHNSPLTPENTCDESDADDVKSEEDTQEIIVGAVSHNPCFEESNEAVSFVHKTKTARKAIPRKVLIRESVTRTTPSPSTETCPEPPALRLAEDEEALFGRLVAGRLRKISDDMMRESTKLKILAVIFQAEFGVCPEPTPKEQDDMTLSSTVVVCNEER